MKKIVLIIAFVTLAFVAQAQIKVHSNGRITFQTLTNSTTEGIVFGSAPDWNVDFNGSCFFKKYLKIGYAIDKYTVNNSSIGTNMWTGQDTLTINHVKVYQLVTDCNTDEYVQSAAQLNQINSMKRSVTISNSSGIVLPSSTDKTLRATDFILINGPFELGAGAELTLMVHECPN